MRENAELNKDAETIEGDKKKINKAWNDISVDTCKGTDVPKKKIQSVIDTDTYEEDKDDKDDYDDYEESSEEKDVKIDGSEDGADDDEELKPIVKKQPGTVIVEEVDGSKSAGIKQIEDTCKWSTII